MSEVPQSLGERIAFYRRRRGLSQAEFARLVGRSESWVSQVERDVRKVDRISVLGQVADVLGVAVSALAPDVPVPAGAEQPPQLEVLRVALIGHPALSDVIDPDPTKVGVPAGELALRCDAAWSDVHGSHYRDAAPALADLIADVEAASRRCDTEDRPELARLAASIYQAASALLAKVGETDAAWVASDRALAVAERSGDAGLVAAGQYRLALSFLGAGRPADAAHAAERAVTAIEAARSQPGPEMTSIRGALHLVLAVAAARTNDRRGTWGHIGHAERAAAALGRDRNDYGTEFGPTNVALHAVTVAVELGDAGEALDRAGRVDTARLSVERRARFLMDVAAAHTQRRRIGDAVTALLDAEALAPEQTRGHPLVRGLVRDLQQAEGRPTDPRLRDLAERITTI
jgi:transcriptional regulator with XRE-family HTH domain